MTNVESHKWEMVWTHAYADGGKRFVFEPPQTWRHVLQSMQSGNGQFVQALKRAMANEYGEGFPVTCECAPCGYDQMQGLFEMTMYPAPELGERTADPTAFREHMTQGLIEGEDHSDNNSSSSSGCYGCVCFPNRDGSALLVSPRCALQGSSAQSAGVVCSCLGARPFAHVSAYLSCASEAGAMELMQHVAWAMQKQLEQYGRVWLNTQGFEVPWLHVRLDTTPRYVRTTLYR